MCVLLSIKGLYVKLMNNHLEVYIILPFLWSFNMILHFLRCVGELLGPESLISPALSTLDPLLKHTPLPTWAYNDGDDFTSSPFFCGCSLKPDNPA